MNNIALQKHDIYSKLIDFNEQELRDVADYIDTLRCKKNQESGKILKLEGILKEHSIDLSMLKTFREETWKHVTEETSGE
jgi:hypothetical protein